MRPTVIKLMSVIGLVVTLSMFTGCGSNDLLDEQGQRYTGSIAIEDLDTETLTIDTVQGFCQNDAEDFGTSTAIVSVSVSPTAAGISLRSYRLEYLPLESEDGTGNIVMPPDLDSPLNDGNLTLDIATGGSAEFEITCISVDTKEEFRTKNGFLFNTETADGQALIAAKNAEVTAKKTEITNKKAQIAQKNAEIDQAIVDGNPTTTLDLQLTRLEDQLDSLEEELEELENEAAALPFAVSPPLPELDTARYKIRVTLNFIDEFDETRTLIREVTVWFGNFDNC